MQRGEKGLDEEILLPTMDCRQKSKERKELQEGVLSLKQLMGRQIYKELEEERLKKKGHCWDGLETPGDRGLMEDRMQKLAYQNLVVR